MNEQRTRFVNPDPDFRLAMGLAESLVGGASHVFEGLGAILAGDVGAELSDHGRIMAEDRAVFTRRRDPVSITNELLVVLDRMLAACDGLEEALRVTRAQEAATALLQELVDPTTFETSTPPGRP